MFKVKTYLTHFSCTSFVDSEQVMLAEKNQSNNQEYTKHMNCYNWHN